jgi:hypothetical protein
MMLSIYLSSTVYTQAGNYKYNGENALLYNLRDTLLNNSTSTVVFWQRTGPAIGRSPFMDKAYMSGTVHVCNLT